MIVAKCPLRISLFGGSTDLETFINEYGRGSVISFSSNLYCYIILHINNRGKIIVNYSQKEEVRDSSEIKNDIARVGLQYFGINEPITITFNTDIMTDGSGLAASSAYMIAFIKAISLYKNLNLTNVEVVKIALELERTFNPLTGYQDPYGCGMGGFKRIDFFKNKKPSFRYLESSFLFKNYNLYLLHTNIKRASTSILKTIDLKKTISLLEIVDNAEKAIEENNPKEFEKLFIESWEQKKKTSSLIIGSPELSFLDTKLSNLIEKNIIKGFKLCGAGGGGYFLLLVNKDMDSFFKQEIEEFKKTKKTIGNLIRINVDEDGCIGKNI